MKKLITILALFSYYAGIAQLDGIYIQQTKQRTISFVSTSLTLDTNNTFSIKSTNVYLGFALPETTLTTTKGKFLYVENEIILYPETTETQRVSYTKPDIKPNDKVTARSHAVVPIDTSEARLIKSAPAFLLRVYKEEYAVCLLSEDNKLMFLKYTEPPFGTNFEFNTNDIRSTNRLTTTINDYDRKYRKELNYSDSLLIAIQLDSTKNNCSKFKEYLLSKQYSKTYMAELGKQLIEANSCPLEIFESTFYSSYFDSDIIPNSKHYSLNTLFQTNQALKAEFFRQLHQNQVICNATISDSTEITKRHRMVLFILRDYKLYINNLPDKALTECELNVIATLEEN